MGLVGGIGAMALKTRLSAPPHLPPMPNWAKIMNHAPIGYLQVDGDNHLFFCNLAAENLLGIAINNKGRKKLLLQIIRSYELDQLIAQTRESLVPQQKDWIFHPTVDDPIHPVEKADLPLRGHSLPLEANHVGIFLEDRQEPVNLAQQRDRWAADVAHDLKTPLTSIRLIAESLLERVEPSLKSWLLTLIKQTMRLSDLVQDILDLGQSDMGINLKLDLAEVNLTAVIHGAWTSLELLAAAKQIKLEYLGAEALVIAADESRMYRLFLNLLDNSIKYSPPQQTITVQVDCLGIIDIIDSGSGFAPSALPHVFDRFYRDAEAPENLAGSGLGLAIAYQIVKAHGGQIQVDNHPQTGGAWVRLQLPLQQVNWGRYP